MNIPPAQPVDLQLSKHFDTVHKNKKELQALRKHEKLDNIR
jgi:hypothetical protein